MHLIIDSHQGDLGGRVDLLSYLNYTLNFTSLTSGPSSATKTIAAWK